MQCLNCGTQLSPGVQFCPNCGKAAPDHVSQSAPIDPTVVASPQQPSPIPPTSYGAPPPPSPNLPPSDPYAGYNTPPAYNMASPQTPPYSYSGTPTPEAPNSYQQYTPVPNYNPAQPFPMPPTTPPRKNPTGLIIGITAAVLVVIIVGFVILPKLASKPTPSPSTTTTQSSSSSASTVETTPTPSTNSSTTPSGNAIDSTAASIVTDAQTASSIDQTTAAPINLTNTFQTNVDVYVTFKLNNNAFNFGTNTGYVAVKFYADSTALTLPPPLDTPLTINQPAPGGFFKVQYTIPTQQGAAELYWCQQSDCSDEKLAQVVTFTVTG